MDPSYNEEMVSGDAVSRYRELFWAHSHLTESLKAPEYFEETAHQLRRSTEQFKAELHNSTQALHQRIAEESQPAEPSAKRQRGFLRFCDVPDVESPNMILVYVSRQTTGGTGAIVRVRTLYVLTHKTSVGITLADHYLGRPEKIRRLFASNQSAIEALLPNVEDIKYTDYHAAQQAQREYENITRLNMDIQTVPLCVLGMDDMDGTAKLYLSFSEAVECPKGIKTGRRGDVRALYRSMERNVLGFATTTPGVADLGNTVDPEITMGLPRRILNSDRFDEEKRELLAWQRKEDFLPSGFDRQNNARGGWAEWCFAKKTA